MKNPMFKSTLLEIKNSFGRWFAILAIVALGVGFFSGLKVCKEAFLETGNTYLQAHSFFDYKLISPFGLDDKDITAISEAEGVASVEGSYSADVMLSDGDNEICVHAITLSDKISTPALTAGKMPQSPNECLGDANYYDKKDIGKKILISKNNKESTADLFAYDSYTITGLATSPLYLNFERGTSSIGDGTVSCFIIIPAEGFSSDVYTEAYVKLSQNAFILSDEYDSISKRAEAPLEEALEERVRADYDSIVNSARKEIEEKKKELQKSKDELAAGKKEADDKEVDLKIAEALLNDKKRQFDSAMTYYDSAKSASYDELEAQYKAHEITYGEYILQKELLNSAYNEAHKKISQGSDDFDKNEAAIKDGKKQLEDARKKLAEAEAKIAEGEKELSDAEKKLESGEMPAYYVMDRNSNIGYVCFENDTSIIEGIAEVFPLFFFIVAALVCMTTMSRMIEEQRTQIGVLKAMGYSVGRILSKYIFYSASSAVIGGIIGFFGGTWLFTWVIWEAYKMMYDFSDVIYVFNWVLGASALLAALLCSVGATLFSCWHELTQEPASLIRPKSPPAGKRVFLEKVPFIWNRLKFLQKVSCRNVFRYKKRFFMMILGICGCTALMATGLGLNDSIKNVVSMQYDEIHHMDYNVAFSRGMSLEDQKEFEDANKDIIGQVMFLYTGAVDAHTDESVKSVNLVVSKDKSAIYDFVDLHNSEGAIDYPQNGQGVINANLAKTLDLNKGDSLTVYDSDMRPLTVEISGLCDNYVYNYLYITADTYEEAFGEPEINTAFIIAPEGTDDYHKAGAKLMDSDGVASVTVTEDFRNRIDNMMKSLNYVIALVIACAGALAFIVLYNLSNINITERIKEIATIKVLGFYPYEVSSYVFRENIMLTAISALIGLPLGTWLHRFVMERIQIDLLSFDIHISPLSYVIAFAGTFLFAFIVNLVMKRKLDKISMTESLKSVE